MLRLDVTRYEALDRAEQLEILDWIDQFIPDACAAREVEVLAEGVVRIIVFSLTEMNVGDRWVRWGEHGVTQLGRAVYVIAQSPPRPMLLAMAT